MDNPRVPSKKVAKAFWEFSVDIFTREGVEANCLLLQDRYGFNINLTLFCLWVGVSGRPALNASNLASALSASAHWHGSVVEPLRRVRRVVQAIGNIDEKELTALRRSLLHDELAAERIEQGVIVTTLAGKADPNLNLDTRLSNSLISLASYLATTRISLDPSGRRALYDVVHAVFDEVPRNKLARLANRVMPSKA